jgi:hypothetical protein
MAGSAVTVNTVSIRSAVSARRRENCKVRYPLQLLLGMLI